MASPNTTPEGVAPEIVRTRGVHLFHVTINEYGIKPIEEEDAAKGLERVSYFIATWLSHHPNDVVSIRRSFELRHEFRYLRHTLKPVEKAA